MKDFHHPHVLELLGMCFDTPDRSPYIVLPFMANGSLKKYLKEKRVHVLNIDSYPKVQMNVDYLWNTSMCSGTCKFTGWICIYVLWYMHHH